MTDQAAATAVALATYRRPDELSSCLRSLAAQRNVPAWRKRVIVVDNDPSGSAKDVVSRVAAETGLDVNYDVESRPGIAAARNRCVALVEDIDFIAFIDDDECVDPDWLATLLEAQQTLDTDFTGGPVLSKLAPGGPGWIGDADVYQRRRRPTGLYDLEEGTLATNNLLIRLSVRETLGTLFDDAYGLSGGSDRHLCLRAEQAGCSFGWCDEALVREVVPVERQGAMWVLRRGYRIGNVEARIDLELGRVSRRATLWKRSARLVVFDGPPIVRHVVKRSWGLAVVHGRRVARGVGLITGSLGVRYLEYRR